MNGWMWTGVIWVALMVVCSIFTAAAMAMATKDPEEEAWDAEGGSPELPWPPPEPEHVRRKREAYAERRVLPPWAGASAREFAEAKAKTASQAASRG